MKIWWNQGKLNGIYYPLWGIFLFKGLEWSAIKKWERGNWNGKFLKPSYFLFFFQLSSDILKSSQENFPKMQNIWNPTLIYIRFGLGETNKTKLLLCLHLRAEALSPFYPLKTWFDLQSVGSYKPVLPCALMRTQPFFCSIFDKPCGWEWPTHVCQGSSGHCSLWGHLTPALIFM